MRTNYDTKEGRTVPDPFEVRLYDANGMHVGGMEVDEEPNREGIVESGGKTYIWNQRNGQWREANGTFKAKFDKAERPAGTVVGTNVAGAKGSDDK